MLMHAASAGSMDLAKYMLKVKCDVNAHDVDGNTALHHAIMNHQEVMAAFIVRKGADTRKRNKEDRTAMQVRSDLHAALAVGDEKQIEEIKKEPEPELDRLEEERSPEMEALFQKFCVAANSEAALGLGANARTGRSSKKNILKGADDDEIPVMKSLSRTETLNYSEFLAFLRGEGLMPSPISLTAASEVFRRVGKELAHEEGFEAGEMHWIHFKQCLCHLANQLNLDPFCGVPRSELVPVAPTKKKKKQEWDDWNLDSHTKEILEKDMNWMQRQLFVMADRAKETTSLGYAAVGRGVTTGKKKLRKQTMSAYCKV